MDVCRTVDSPSRRAPGKGPWSPVLSARRPVDRPLDLLARRLGALALVLLMLSQGAQWWHVHPLDGRQGWQGGHVGMSAAHGRGEAPCLICWAHQALHSHALVPHVFNWEAAMLPGGLPRAEVQCTQCRVAGGPRAPPTA